MTYRPRRLRPHHNGSERWVIESDASLTMDVRQKIRAQWSEFMRPTGRRHRLLVMDGGLRARRVR